MNSFGINEETSRNIKKLAKKYRKINNKKGWTNFWAAIGASNLPICMILFALGVTLDNSFIVLFGCPVSIALTVIGIHKANKVPDKKWKLKDDECHNLERIISHSVGNELSDNYFKDYSLIIKSDFSRFTRYSYIGKDGFYYYVFKQDVVLNNEEEIVNALMEHYTQKLFIEYFISSLFKNLISTFEVDLKKKYIFDEFLLETEKIIKSYEINEFSIKFNVDANELFKSACRSRFEEVSSIQKEIDSKKKELKKLEEEKVSKSKSLDKINRNILLSNQNHPACNVVGVRFLNQAKGCYYYLCRDRLNIGDHVTVWTSEGEKTVEVVFFRHYSQYDILPYEFYKMKSISRVVSSKHSNSGFNGRDYDDYDPGDPYDDYLYQAAEEEHHKIDESHPFDSNGIYIDPNDD